VTGEQGNEMYEEIIYGIFSKPESKSKYIRKAYMLNWNKVIDISRQSTILEKGKTVSLTAYKLHMKTKYLDPEALEKQLESHNPNTGRLKSINNVECNNTNATNVCWRFQQGKCTRGSNCPYQHVKSSSPPLSFATMSKAIQKAITSKDPKHQPKINGKSSASGYNLLDIIKQGLKGDSKYDGLSQQEQKKFLYTLLSQGMYTLYHSGKNLK
jgi:hypothetical protein